MAAAGDWSPGALPRGEGRIALVERGASAELVLDNPARRNAVSPGMMADLAAAVAALEGRAGLASVLVRGEGGAAFCAGGDLRAVQAHLMGEAAGMNAYMTGLLDRLAALPAVVIAAVEGAALGGGAEILTCADLAFAAPDATVGFVHAALGVSPGWGGGRRLIAKIGPRRAVQALAFAERLDAAAAARLGLVDAVAPGPVAQARAAQDRLATLPIEAVRAAVALCRGGDEPALFASLWGGPAHRAALARARGGGA